MVTPLPPSTMLATLGGTLALLVGLAVLVLPLLVPELSRARDSVWGAVVLLLGLALVTSAERLTGSPMLVVLCGGLLLGRLSSEVARGRWLQLSPEERQALLAAERWQRSLTQLGAAGQRLLAGASGLLAWLAARRTPKATSKRWVRQEEPAAIPAEAPAQAEQANPPADSNSENEHDAAPITVTSFAAIDALLDEAPLDEALTEAEPSGQARISSDPGSEVAPASEVEAETPGPGDGAG